MRKHLLLEIEETVTGFTLAEVLITLVVIGVIAALTIPALIQNIQDAQLKTAWKEAYSMLNQASNRILLDNAGSMLGLFSSRDDMQNAFLPYLSYTKRCPSNMGLGNCWHSNGNFYYLGGAPATWNNNPSAYLNNGMLIIFEFSTSGGQNCGANPGGGATILRCGWIAVDVNGFNPPNTTGKDIFMVNVQEKGISAFGVPGDNPLYNCSTANSNWGSGYGCSALYLKQ